MLWKEGSSKIHSICALFWGEVDKYERNLTLLVESEAFILFSVLLMLEMVSKAYSLAFGYMLCKLTGRRYKTSGNKSSAFKNKKLIQLKKIIKAVYKQQIND